jgi:DNA polymerase I-like protein with 3'-5' exonuclease and polymerase domains
VQVKASNFELITSADALRAVCERLSAHAAIGFDTETTSLDPYSGRVRLVQLAAPGEAARIIDLDAFRRSRHGDLSKDDALAPLRALLSAPRPVKIAHNAKFDAKWIRHTLGVEVNGLFDTLLASQLISGGDTEDRHNLAAVAARYLDETLDKAQQMSNWGGELSREQLEYAARDAVVLIPLREALIERLKGESLIGCAALEFECVMPLALLELNGIFLDAARWREQMKIVEARRAALAEELQNMLAAGASQGLLFANARQDINLDSHTQLSAALKRLGVPVPDSTRNWKLQPLAKKYPVVEKLLEYRTVQKSLTSYGENILTYINPKTHRIHAHFHQIGAPTGRMSCLTGETLIVTAQNLKPLRDVKAGDGIQTSFGLKRVVRAWSNGVREVFKITLRDGRSLRATADHLFLTGRADEWARLSELRAGDNVFVSLQQNDLAANQISPSIEQTVDFAERQIRAVAIESIVPDGADEVYDLTIEDVHEFIANGIVVHNCTDPNIQQVPHDVAYRRCFRAPEKRKLVILDYSQIELRILAEMTGDEGFIHAFRTGADFHRTTAAQVFNVAPEAVTSEQRSFAKRLNFGVVYGIGAQRFSMLTGSSVTEAEDLLRRYFATYPKLDAWLRDAARRAVRDRTARTLAGRLARFNFDAEDKQAVSAAQRNGKNFPIQGSSADILKRAMRLLHNKLENTSAQLVNVVHDEIVIETDAGDAEEIAKSVEAAMCAAGEEFVRKVPVKVESVVADEWVK